MDKVKQQYFNVVVHGQVGNGVVIWNSHSGVLGQHNTLMKTKKKNEVVVILLNRSDFSIAYKLVSFGLTLNRVVTKILSGQNLKLLSTDKFLLQTHF